MEMCEKVKGHFDGFSFAIGSFIFGGLGLIFAGGIYNNLNYTFEHQPMVSKWDGKITTTHKQGHTLVSMNKQNPFSLEQRVTSFDMSSSDPNSIIVRAIDPFSYNQALDYLRAQKCSLIEGKIAEVGAQDKFIKEVVPVEDSSCLG